MIGGSLGSFFGPWGAAVGATVGHFMVDRKKTVSQQRLAMRLLAVMAGAVHDIACCDGRFTPEKDEMIRTLLCGINAKLGSPLDAAQLAVLMNGQSRVDHGIVRLGEMVRGHHELGCEALVWLWQIAASDGDISPDEAGLIELFIHYADISPQDARHIAGHFVRPPPGRDAGPHGRRAACDTLGVPYSATMDEIKSAYRVMSQKYHPDKHAGLDPDIKALAAEKFAQIKRAYDTLARG